MNVRSASAKEVCGYLGISQPTFSRLVPNMQAELLTVGRARATRYALKRSVPGVGNLVSIYAINEAGEATRVANLHGVYPKGYYLEALERTMGSGFFDDLPYLMSDLRPSGFLGRLIPRRYPELGFPRDIQLWSGDHCLEYLSKFGWNPVGNLIVGEQAFQRYLENVMSPPDQVSGDRRGEFYPEMAESILNFGPAGSSAAGEQPKFPAIRMPQAVPVLVKFSPMIQNELHQRSADLLLCEHIAHEVLRVHGRQSPLSCVVKAKGRVFLEMERFDRIGLKGRRGVISLAALDAAFVGRGGAWTESCEVLLSQGRINRETHREVRWIELFGKLIANNDMHLGNLSFLVKGTDIHGLAPLYDMLPMQYAPRYEQIPEVDFQPGLPEPRDSDIWKESWSAALDFWQRVAASPEISPAFRAIARANAEKLESLRDIEKMLPAKTLGVKGE